MSVFSPEPIEDSGRICQCDRNYGRRRGYLVSIVGETMPGYWELIGSYWLPDQVIDAAVSRR